MTSPKYDQLFFLFLKHLISFQVCCFRSNKLTDILSFSDVYDPIYLIRRDNIFDRKWHLMTPSFLYLLIQILKLLLCLYYHIFILNFFYFKNRMLTIASRTSLNKYNYIKLTHQLMYLKQFGNLD